jgi:hypothetical protein
MLMIMAISVLRILLPCLSQFLCQRAGRPGPLPSFLFIYLFLNEYLNTMACHDEVEAVWNRCRNADDRRRIDSPLTKFRRLLPDA